MTKKYMRIEFLLPKFYNLGKKGPRKAIPKKKFSDVDDELMENIGGYTIASSPVLGTWRDHKTRKIFKDENRVYFVLCPARNSNMKFFSNFRKKLEKDFKQREIMMFYHEISMF